MPDQNSAAATAVLIAGAGPVGLALACELGIRGVDCIVVEKRDGTLTLPKMSSVSARNMEFCRRWGIADEVRTAIWPENRTTDFVYVNGLRGAEVARFKLPSLSDWGKLDFTPVGGAHCPQIYFDPILARRARACPSVRWRYEARLDGFTQDGAGVSAVVTDAKTGASERISARYLIGCDGSTGMVRDALGITRGGLGVVADSVNIFFRSPQLAGLHDKGWARFYRMVDQTGCWGELIPIDGNELWRLTVFDDGLAAKDPAATLARMLGADCPHDLINVATWERRDVVADSYGHGRVFIAGDAAHECSPTGGLGMHTGIEEAVNLAWKLEAMAKGWGGAALVDSYPSERRPIAVRNVTLATNTYKAIRGIPGSGSEQMADWRADLRRMSPTEKDKMDFGYDGSPICWPDGNAGTADARPGRRAPHAWLADGRSTLDLFGAGFSLLRLGTDAPDTSAMEKAFATRSVPLAVETISAPAIAALYGRRLVLVRPDGHVAWRSDALPGNPLDLADCVRGAAGASANDRIDWRDPGPSGGLHDERA